MRGAAHKLKDKPCQDAVKAIETPDGVILAVADGHGSERSPNSAEGAEAAVDVAIEQLQPFFKNCCKPPAKPNSIERFTLPDGLPRKITQEWWSRILFKETSGEDIPLNEDEKNEIFRKYGATLLAVVASAEYLVIFQLGDGDVLLVDEDGSINRPIERDPRLFADETTSLCLPEAWLSMEVKSIPISNNPPALILVSTDGYSNSFVSTEDFEQTGSDYLQAIRRDGLEAVSAKLEGWLNEASEQGSGDDITLGIICRADMAKGETER